MFACVFGEQTSHQVIKIAFSLFKEKKTLQENTGLPGIHRNIS